MRLKEPAKAGSFHVPPAFSEGLPGSRFHAQKQKIKKAAEAAFLFFGRQIHRAARSALRVVFAVVERRGAQLMLFVRIERHGHFESLPHEVLHELVGGQLLLARLF